MGARFVENGTLSLECSGVEWRFLDAPKSCRRMCCGNAKTDEKGSDLFCSVRKLRVKAPRTVPSTPQTRPEPARVQFQLLCEEVELIVTTFFSIFLLQNSCRGRCEAFLSEHLAFSCHLFVRQGLNTELQILHLTTQSTSSSSCLLPSHHSFLRRSRWQPLPPVRLASFLLLTSAAPLPSSLPLG